MQEIHFVNLTEGLRAIAEHGLVAPHYLRIQSTWCEQKRWRDVLWAVSDDFYMNVALGRACFIYDYSAKGMVPRSIWQGLAWVQYCWQRRLRGIVRPALLGRSAKCDRYFAEEYAKLDRRTLGRLDYYRRFMVNAPEEITAITNRIDGTDPACVTTRLAPWPESMGEEA